MVNFLNNTKTGCLQKRRILRAASEIIVIAAGVILFVTLFGAASYDLQGVSVKGYLTVSTSGRTVIELPPLGSLSADTHRGPVEFHLEVTGIQPDVINGSLSAVSNQDEWVNRLESEAQRPLLFFSLRQLVIGGIGGAFTFMIVFRPSLRRILGAGGIGLLLISVAFGYSLSTFKIEAFKQPEYHGIIAAAPRVLHLADEMYNKLQDFKDKTDVVVDNINTLIGQVERLDVLSEPEEEKIKILIVSDSQNNPISVDFIESLVRNFEVDIVIDAGDLTDFGSPLEAQAFGRIGALGVPYVFAPGNHDSPDVIAFLRTLPNVKVLDGSVVRVKGISILGSPDPWAYGQTVEADNEVEGRKALQKQADDLASVLATADDVNVVVVHNPVAGRKLAGQVPVIITGHTHRISITEKADSFLINPGTTGAAGFRGLQADNGVPYSAMVLHLNKATKKPTVLDIIRYDPLSGSFTAERRLLGDSLSQDDKELLSSSLLP
ncbi:MAG: metallophosphoesterase family protein [Peptococcaceae bacterium]|nr:metallophosphoesterase family protein [Peptococcaceae bacterium]